MGKNTLAGLFFIITFSFQLIFYHLPEEIKFPLFLVFLLLTTILFSQSKPLLIPKTFTLLFLLYVLANVYSSFFSPYKFQASLEIIKLLGIFFLVILGTNLFRNKKILQATLLVLTLITSFWALSGILEYTSRLRTEKFLGLFEPFHWPTLSASFFLLIYPMNLLLFLVDYGRGLRKMILFASLFLIFVAWILTRSYLFLLLFLSIFLPFSFFFFYSKQFKRASFIKEKFKEIIIFLFLVGVCIPNFLPSFGGREIYREIALFQDKIFFQDNREIWRFSLKTIQNNLLKGIGIGTFGPFYRQNLAKPWTWADFTSNELLQTFVETGILGFLTELILFIYIFLIALKRLISFRKEESPLFISSSLSVVLFLSLSLGNPSFRIFPILIAFFIIFSSLMSNQGFAKINQKLMTIFIIPILTISFLFLADGFLVRKGQGIFAKENSPLAEKIFLITSKRLRFALNPKAFFWLSAIELEKENPNKALSYLKQAKNLLPFDRKIDYQIAKTEYLRGNTSRAEDILSEAISKSSFVPPEYYASLAKLYLEKSFNKEALTILNKSLIVYPFDSNFYLKSKHVLEATDASSALQEIFFILYNLTKSSGYLSSYYQMAL